MALHQHDSFVMKRRQQRFFRSCEQMRDSIMVEPPTIFTLID